MTYAVVLAFPVLAYFGFRALPFRLVIPITLIAGYLLLPARWELDLPLVPPLDKATIPTFVALALVLLFAPRSGHETLRNAGVAPDRTAQFTGWLPRNAWARLCLLLIVVMPIATTLNNLQPVSLGDFTLPGLQARDAYNLVSMLLVPLIPLLIARKYLSDEAGHHAILLVIAIAGLVYSLPTLAEVRLSPQLHVWVYGYFPHSWLQHIRGDSFRPVVFMPHGLVLSLFLCMACLSIVAYFRAIQGDRKIIYFLASIYLLVVLVLTRSLGAALIGVVLLPVLFVFGRRMQLLTAALIASLLFTYPVVRTAGISPLQYVADVVERYQPDRAASLEFRIEAERVVLARANERPLTGWGGWGREIALNEDGSRFATRDGLWLIMIGQFGWIFYIAMFSLLTAPIMALFWLASRHPVSFATSGLALVLAANLVDLIPNSGLMPMTWMMAGALLGRAEALGRAGATPQRLSRRDAADVLPDGAVSRSRGPSPNGTALASGVGEGNGSQGASGGTRYSRFAPRHRRG